MDNYEDIFKQISSNIRTKKDKETILSVLDEVINQTYKLENEFNDLKDVFSLVLESLPNPIWVINNDGSYFYYNSYASKLNGIFDKLPNNFYHHSFFECEILFNNDFYLIQKNTKHDKVIIAATNITNEKRKERLISMGQISAHLAHEIRNPIGAITLIASSLLKRVNDKDKLYVLEIKKAIWRVERLINVTLLFSRGIKEISKQVHNSDIIKSSIVDFIDYIEYSKDIKIIYDIKVNHIICDGELLYLLLQNIILNAIEAIEEMDNVDYGVIRIEFFNENKKQILNIYDSGIIVSDEDNLFEAFKTTKIKGNGLGLSLCKQIVEAHNGAIIYNAYPDKHFRVIL